MSFEELFPRDASADEDEPECADEEYSAPPWFGPPQDELGVAVPETLVLARSSRAVVALPYVVAYSTGVTFELVALARGVKQSRVNAIFHAQHGVDPDDDPQDDFLRIGVELADGTRVSNLGGRFGRHGHDFNDEPSGPVLVQHGGGGGSGGGGGTVTMRPGFWLWPLPPPGAMRIWCEWPGLEVGLASVEIDATAIRVAAQRARPLWAPD